MTTTRKTMKQIQIQKDNALDANGFPYFFEPQASVDFTSTNATCGSPEKIQVMRERAERGQPLWHSGDQKEMCRVPTTRSIQRELYGLRTTRYTLENRKPLSE